MKRLIGLVFVTLLAFPAFAQDDGDFGFGGGDSLFGDPGDDFFNNDPFANDQPAVPKFDPLVEIRRLLADSKAPPLDKNQEKPLKKVYEQELKAASKAFEKQFGVSLDSAMAAQGRRRRGSGNPLAAELGRVSNELRDRVIAALRIDQQRVLRMYQSEQIRVARLDQLTQNLTLAGIALTPEQRSQVDALFARESRLRTLMIVEARGAPHQSNVARLEAQTSQRVAAVLDQSQKDALLVAMAKAREPQPPRRRTFRQN